MVDLYYTKLKSTSDDFDGTSLNPMWTEDFETGGSATINNGKLELVSGDNSMPQFSGIYKIVSGDFDFTCLLSNTSITDIGATGATGIAFVTDNIYFTVYRQYSNYCRFYWYDYGGYNSGGGTYWSNNNNQYMRIKRSGIQLTIYCSDDNINWSLITTNSSTKGTGSGVDGEIRIFAYDSTSTGFTSYFEWFKDFDSVGINKIALYDSDSTSWDKTFSTVVDSTTYYARLESDLSHQFNSDLRIRVNGITYGFMIEDIDSPRILLSPTTINNSVLVGNNASNNTFTVKNSGINTLNYSITDSTTWLSVSPTSGDSTNEEDIITISYDTTSLSAGTYNATVTVTDSSAINSPQSIPISLVVGNYNTISFIGVKLAQSTAGSTFNFDLSTLSCQTNDLVLICCTVEQATYDYSFNLDNTGWTNIVNNVVSWSTTILTNVWWNTIDGTTITTGSTITLTQGSPTSDDTVCYAVVFRNVDTTTPFRSVTTKTSISASNPTSDSKSGINTSEFVLFGASNCYGTTWTPPTGWTELADNRSGTSSSNVSTALCTITNVTSTASVAYNSASDDIWSSWTAIMTPSIS